MSKKTPCRTGYIFCGDIEINETVARVAEPPIIVICIAREKRNRAEVVQEGDDLFVRQA
jgi:hypothetical protein